MSDYLKPLLACCPGTLKAKQELMLFTRLDKSRSVVEKLENKRKRTSQESSQLGIARRAVREVTDKILKSNIPMVVRMANRRGTSMATTATDDLISIGLEKLSNCIDKFDVTRGFKFSTYLGRALANAFNAAIAREQKHYSDRINDEDDQVKEHYRSKAYEPIGKEGQLSDIREAVKHNVAELSPIELEVIKSNYGLDKEAIIPEEIGLHLGIPKAQVEEYRMSGLTKLRDFFEKDDEPCRATSLN
ncbi:MAG: sigma-70 family RNA polymerase sigma factor [Candidatus Sabulitectum sp.]|nr:sigma-70 family RNA polymerase sigma factor [Candidatus Sabulitectum sp.]